METLANGLQVEFTETAPCCFAVKAVVPAASVKKAYADVLTKYMTQVRQPGFRAGHTPKSLVLKQYGSAVKGECAERLLNDNLPAIFSEKKKSLAGEIEWKGGAIPALDENADYVIEFTCECYADIEAPQYKGLALTSDEKAVKQEDVDKAYEGYLQSRGKYDKVERGAAAGDMLKVDYTTDADDATKADKSASYLLNGNNSWISLHEPEMLPGITTILAGLKADEKKDAEIEFPADFRCGALAGKKIAFHFTVKEVHGYTAPELNEEFFKSFGVKDADELKAQIRRQMEYYARQMANGVLNEQIVDKLTDAADFPLPPKAVEKSVAKAVAERIEQKRAWKETEDAINAAKADIEKECRANVVKQFKLEQILGKIADAEKIQVSGNDMVQFCQVLAQRQQMKLEDVFKMVRKNPNAMSNIASNIMDQKAMAVVFDNADITFTDPAVAAARAEEKAKAAAAKAAAAAEEKK